MTWGAELSRVELLPVSWSDPSPRAPTRHGARILMQLLIEIEALATLEDGSPAHSVTPVAEDVAKRGIPYRPAVWFDTSTVADRKNWSRATQRLEMDGHVLRTRERRRNRVTHLVPTPAGFAWALDAAPWVDRAVMARVLERLEWGELLLDTLNETTAEESRVPDSEPMASSGPWAAEATGLRSTNSKDSVRPVAANGALDGRRLGDSPEFENESRAATTCTKCDVAPGGEPHEVRPGGTCEAATGEVHVDPLGETTSTATAAVRATAGFDRELRPSELTRLLNSTPLGEVLDDRRLYRHRSRAGYRIGSGRRVDLLKYVAWLATERHEKRPRRRSHRRGNDGITQREVLDLLEAQRYRCNLTGRELTPDTASLDHVVPVSRGGRHVIANAQALHEDVNRAKHTLTNDEFVTLCHEVVKHTKKNPLKRTAAP